MKLKEELVKIYDNNPNEIDPKDLHIQTTLLDFLDSFYYEGKRKINLNNKMVWKKLLSSKEILDFMVKRSTEYKLIYEMLLNYEYLNDIEFGKILELDAFPDANVAVNDKLSGFDITEISRFNSKEIVQKIEKYKNYNGFISRINAGNKEKLILKYTNINPSKLYYPTLDEFDTIISINPTRKRDILDLYLYGINNNKNIFTGYLTNFYDMNLDYKENIMNIVIELLNKKKIIPETYEVLDSGSKTDVLVHIRK